MSMKKSRMGNWKGKAIRGRGPGKQIAAAAKLRSVKAYKTALKNRRKKKTRATRK